MWLFIEPSDVWLFRDGKPFDAGADHRAASLFPPNPSTLQGAIRSNVLALYGVDFEDFRRGQAAPEIHAQIGYPPTPGAKGNASGRLGSLQLHGPYLARCEGSKIQPYFPCPLDLLEVDGKITRLKAQQADPFEANWPAESTLVPLIVPDEKTPGEPVVDWLSAEGLKQYLNGGIPPRGEFVSHSTLFEQEPRFGIGLETASKRPQEGLLYQVEYIRPQKGVGLLVEVQGLDESQWGEAGVFSMGGEGRAARYRVTGNALEGLSSPEDGSKLYLPVPTYFEKGWLPRTWDDFFSPAPTLKSAAVGHSRAIGGWDVAHNRQKPMRRFVPAGSVYIFDQSLKPTGSSVCDDTTDAQMGYGTYFIGR
jgi:CRISPR-associated protein Cmr3